MILRLFARYSKKTFLFTFLLLASSVAQDPIRAWGVKIVKKEALAQKKPKKTASNVKRIIAKMFIGVSKKNYGELDKYYETDEFKSATRAERRVKSLTYFRLLEQKDISRELKWTIAKNTARAVAFPLLMKWGPKAFRYISEKQIEHFTTKITDDAELIKLMRTYRKGHIIRELVETVIALGRVPMIAPFFTNK